MSIRISDESQVSEAFLSEDEDTPIEIEEIPPQYISNPEEIIKLMEECSVEIKPEINELKFRKCCVSVPRVSVHDLKTDYPVEFEVEFVKSDTESGGIFDDSSDILDAYPEEGEDLGDGYAEVDKILAFNVGWVMIIVKIYFLA